MRYYTEADAFKTWRILSHNPTYTGETEGFGFSNGQATVSALPRSLQCHGCSEEDPCRIHQRIAHLNNIENYPRYVAVKQANSGRQRLDQRSVYRILSEEEYEAEFGGIEDEVVEAAELALDTF